jgi:hypothetical protein
MQGAVKSKTTRRGAFFIFPGNLRAKRPIRGVNPKRRRNPMSRRRIRKSGINAERAGRSNPEKLIDFAFYPFWNPETGRVELRSYSWEIDREDLPNLNVWRDSHALLPDAYWYQSPESAPIIATALRTLAQNPDDPEDMLKAIAVLGHSPIPEALKALDEVGRGGGAYAGVARLALCECAAMFGGTASGSVAC